MKKTVWIICGSVILLVLIFSILYYNYQAGLRQAKQRNEEYESYTTNQILGSSLMTLMNKASNDNEKNQVKKDENGCYIENDTNSIKIEVKFLEAEKAVSMERIQSLGEEAFLKNYRSMTFSCTQKQYHEKTKQIKYLLFEQV